VDPGRGGSAGQFGAVAAGALDSHRDQPAVGAEPGQQVPVAAGAGGKLTVGQVPPDTVNHRCVVGVAVSVHTADGISATEP
jgi:hypothetical protein